MKSDVGGLATAIDGLIPSAGRKPTLVYFNVIGIGWPIRCLLHINDVDYDYIPVTFKQWMCRTSDGHQLLKSTTTNGHLPLYVDSEVRIGENSLILSRLGQQTGAMGGNAADALAIEQVLAQCNDALFHWSGLFSVNIHYNLPPEVSQARLDAFMGRGAWGVVADGFRNNLRAFRRFLEANVSRSGFIVGSQLSVADLAAFNVLCNWYKAFDREVFSTEFPDLDAYIHRVAMFPGVADYIRNVQEPTVWFDMPDVALRLTSKSELMGLVQLP